MTRRLLKHALELRKPVLFLNVGPTRADNLPGVNKVEIPAGKIMRDVVRAVVYVPTSLSRSVCSSLDSENSGTRTNYDPVLRDLLISGVVKPPTDYGEEPPSST